VDVLMYYVASLTSIAPLFTHALHHHCLHTHCIAIKSRMPMATRLFKAYLVKLGKSIFVLNYPFSAHFTQNACNDILWRKILRRTNDDMLNNAANVLADLIRNYSFVFCNEGLGQQIRTRSLWGWPRACLVLPVGLRKRALWASL